MIIASSTKKAMMKLSLALFAFLALTCVSAHRCTSAGRHRSPHHSRSFELFDSLFSFEHSAIPFSYTNNYRLSTSPSRRTHGYSYQIEEDPLSYTLTLSLPGHDSRTVDLKIEKTGLENGFETVQELVVSPKDADSPGAFEPTRFVIDQTVDTSSITSFFRRGILEVKAPKFKRIEKTSTIPIADTDPSSDAKDLAEAPAAEEPLLEDAGDGITIRDSTDEKVEEA